ncbi:MAG: DUF4974 domain-containing protein [Cyclobacteriaceae bacterium]
MTDREQNSIYYYLQNESFVKWVLNPTDELNHYWSRWLQEKPDQRHVITQARAFIQSAKIRHNPRISSEAHNRILLNAVANNQRKNRQEQRIGVSSRRSYWSVAAALILLIGFIGFGWLRDTTDEHQAVVEKVPTVNIKETKAGEKLDLMLPDGSHVRLNSLSSITYPSNFEEGAREVKISGEVFFEVVRDITRPFVVGAGATKTTVLGTSFNINSFDQTGEDMITVASGKVSVEPLDQSGASQQVYLTKGDQALYISQGYALEKRQVSLEYYLAWKDNIIIFRDEPLSEVFKRLERWYGVSFEIADEMTQASCRIHAQFNNESLENVLRSMQAVHEFEFQIEGKMIYIRGSGCE